jgi:hypothetical protein
MCGQLHASGALPPGKYPRYSLDRMLDGPQSRSRRYGVEYKSETAAVKQKISMNQTLNRTRAKLQHVTTIDKNTLQILYKMLNSSCLKSATCALEDDQLGRRK